MVGLQARPAESMPQVTKPCQDWHRLPPPPGLRPYQGNAVFLHPHALNRSTTKWQHPLVPPPGTFSKVIPDHNLGGPGTGSVGASHHCGMKWTERGPKRKWFTLFVLEFFSRETLHESTGDTKKRRSGRSHSKVRHKDLAGRDGLLGLPVDDIIGQVITGIDAECTCCTVGLPGDPLPVVLGFRGINTLPHVICMQDKPRARRDQGSSVRELADIPAPVP